MISRATGFPFPCVSRAEREVSVSALTTGVPLAFSARIAKKRSFLIEILLVGAWSIEGRREADKFRQRQNDGLRQSLMYADRSPTTFKKKRQLLEHSTLRRKPGN